MNQEELDYNIRICAFDLGVDKKYVRPIPKNELVIAIASSLIAYKRLASESTNEIDTSLFIKETPIFQMLLYIAFS